jgi:GNAT superfamily N-acetyltransferase
VSTVTECLQYPDFSCVVLYKKLVVGFAFMVPDVGLNEAYISFLFTRPEWRRAGIATFMLYHLIQASGNPLVVLGPLLQSSMKILCHMWLKEPRSKMATVTDWLGNCRNTTPRKSHIGGTEVIIHTLDMTN